MGANLIIDMTHIWGPAMAYVMLSRVMQLSQLFIIGELHEEKITKRNTRPTAFNSHCYSTESLSCTGQRLTRLPMLTKADPSL